MKKNYVKVTATTALLSAALFGGPLIGSAHWEEKGQANDWKQSYQKMEKQPWNKKIQKNDKQWKDKNVSKDTYETADAYGKNTILPLLASIETAEANKDWEALEANYHKLSKELKKGTSLFYKVEGKENRNKLMETYKAPAEAKRAELALPISIYMAVNNLEKSFEKGDKAKIEQKLSKVKMLMDKLENVENNTLLQDLAAKVKGFENKLQNQTA
ncbi:hypothetical protein [Psychrobacillus lasiicapitis]|uniref:SbsC C-terminal domain-containing protein n=1 Tax=Psychrobacillus lasiicapitis TaxID=1636719 RepID=A0A544T2Q1_9BACI|nr:hypothetical protein [Psychrobacillus lasiicapitis]TQR11729.1 hypothetical protein FG382_14015 [Psychrobacillus lasiicapitis]GGA19029.1 hypothetical protein GCM10011384_05340 [Psychrobacillus lasiicapitis]